MSVTMKTINQQQIIFNILTWFILLLPVTIIFSNALSDIIVVCTSFFFIYISIKDEYPSDKTGREYKIFKHL